MTLSLSQRPLPTGIVGLSHPDRGPRQEHREAAPSGTLLVGQAIKVTGQIESCQNLIVEGRVEAAIAAKSLTVLKGGLFKGTAVVDQADIAGRFEGSLTVHGALSIKSSGQATGQIRYQRITIDGGGEIAGDVAAGTEAEAGAEVGAEALVPAKRKKKGHVA
jgi:cytoskeletal protein CcmA (bactofilin family)